MLAPQLVRESEERSNIALEESYWKQRVQDLERENLALTRLTGAPSASAF